MGRVAEVGPGGEGAVCPVGAVGDVEEVLAEGEQLE